MPGQRDIERIREERDRTGWRVPDELVAAVAHPPSVGLAGRGVFGLDEIFARVLATPEDELAGSSGVLLWVGLAAGLALIVWGRYQSFTENTFIPVALVLTWVAGKRGK